MKLADRSTSVEVGGVESAPSQFKIKTGREAFNILSSKLYNDKIRAIIRELSCNAYDSHVEAGKKDIPFEVHLPTIFDPVFTIRDFGVGLSHENVMNLYCTYFGTTRSSSNEFVGALGLGSKSPFSYTDGFTVISQYEGKRRIYSAFVGEVGPYIQCQSEPEGEWIDEDEPLFYIKTLNGLEISFPVKQEDFREFENKACKVFEFFDPPPKTNKEISIKKQTYSLRKERWGLRTNTGYYSFDDMKPRAIQGMVPYSVGSIDTSRLSNAQKQLLDMPLDIFFPIGELEVAASREALSNDERTISNILQAVNLVFTEMTGEVKEKIRACKTMWEAKCYIYKILHSDNSEFVALVTEALENSVFDGVYPNFTFSKEDLTLCELDFAGCMLLSFESSYRSKVEANRSHVFKMIGDEVKTAQDKVTAGLVTRKGYERRIYANEDTIFVINDCTRGGETYIHYYLQQAEDNNGPDKKTVVYYVTRSRKDVSIDTVKRNALAMIKLLGYPPSVMLSELKDRYRSSIYGSSDPKAKVNRDILVFDRHSDYRRYQDGYERAGWRAAWQPWNPSVDETEDDEEIVDKKFYVPIKKLMPIDGEWSYAEDLYKFFNSVRASKMFPDITQETLLFALPESSPLRKKTDEWVEFLPYVYTTLPSLLTEEVKNVLSLHLNPFTEPRGIEFSKILESDLPQTSCLRQFCDDYTRASSSPLAKGQGQSLTEVIAYAIKLGKMNKPETVDFRKKWFEVKKQYPLLGLFSSSNYYGYEDYTPHVIKYVKMCDESKDQVLPMILTTEEENDELSVI